MMAEKHYRFSATTVLALSAISFGCSSANVKDDLTECTEPRPEICTMDYTPVCGRQRVSGEEQWKTYSSACTACSDSTVIGYVKGACAASEK
jgi:hypothetical protein